MLPLPHFDREPTFEVICMPNDRASHCDGAWRRWPVSLALVVCLLTGVVGFFLGKPAPASLPDSATKSPVNSPTSADVKEIEREARAAREIRRPKDGAIPWDDRWRTVANRPRTPARTRELAALIEELARTDHDRALTLAANDDNWRLREIFRDAALRGWASTAPDAAGDYALALRAEDRRAAVAAVLQGTSNDPNETVRLALRLSQADPGPAGDYGHAAIATLVDNGHFADAVKFSREAGTETHPYLLKSAFFQWARNQPDEAFAACAQIEDQTLQSRARDEVISGWAWADPKALADYALKASSADARKAALNEALPLWMEREPEVAINWINAQSSGPEFDAGVAAAANLQAFIVNQPDTAMNIAARVSDSKLRTQTLRSVFRQWALADPVAAQAYANARESAVDRELLAAEFNDLAP
jgi:hypothetical protein